MNNTIKILDVKFNDSQVDFRAVLNQYTKQISAVPIKKYETDIAICKGTISPSIKRT